MSNSINSSAPSNLIESFDVQEVLQTLRLPLEALKTLVDKNTVEALRKKLRNFSTPTESRLAPILLNSQGEILHRSTPTESSQASRLENPYQGKTLSTILSENSSEPLEDKDFLNTVKQIREACVKYEISDNYSLFDQLEKLHSTGINSTDKQGYERFKEELILGIIATGAEKVLGKLATGGHTEQENNLVKVLKLIEREWLKSSSVRVNSSLVEQFELEPTINSSGKHVAGRPADPILLVSLGDQKLAQLQQHDVRIFLKSAQAWRADLNKEQLADNSQSKEPSAKNKITSFLSSHRFFERR